MSRDWTSVKAISDALAACATERDRLIAENKELRIALTAAANAAWEEANQMAGRTVAQAVYHAVKEQTRAAIAKAKGKS